METLIFISEEHIGAEATPQDAHNVIVLMSAEGWKVIYGDKPWQFQDDVQRERFVQGFNWALDVVSAEKQGVTDTALTYLAKRRIGMNKSLFPHEAFLLQKRPNWKGNYWRWLISTPTAVILDWVNFNKNEDTSS